MITRICFSTLTIVAALTSAAAHAQFINYHVGRDNLETFVTGTYAGLPNPNYQRLTFLRFNDLEVSDPASSHWHAIGAYSYAGPTGSPTVLPTNGNNRIPETFTGFAPLPLLPGSGAFVGKLVSGIPNGTPQSHDHYDRLEMRSVQELSAAAPGTTEHFLYNSSGGRWNQPLGANARIGLQLLSQTPGLNVATLAGTPILENDLDVFEIGQGDDWSFTPVFWADGNAAPGTYSASLKLVDLSGGIPDSGTFHLDFQVIPEPATFSLALGSAALALVLVRRRR
jgi:hypothetical protein